MILAECLWPGMTRQGFTYRTMVPIKPEDIDKFPRTKTELLFPLASVALREFNGGVKQLSAEAKTKRGMQCCKLGYQALFAANLNDETGCWIPGEQLTDDEHTTMLWNIAEHDMGGEPLDAPQDKLDIHVCDEPSCLNAWHYDFTHKKQYRDTLMKPDYRFF